VNTDEKDAKNHEKGTEAGAPSKEGDKKVDRECSGRMGFQGRRGKNQPEIWRRNTPRALEKDENPKKKKKNPKGDPFIKKATRGKEVTDGGRCERKARRSEKSYGGRLGLEKNPQWFTTMRGKTSAEKGGGPEGLTSPYKHTQEGDKVVGFRRKRRLKWSLQTSKRNKTVGQRGGRMEEKRRRKRILSLFKIDQHRAGSWQGQRS